jgi:probable F420-dependent oxidoreductase
MLASMLRDLGRVGIWSNVFRVTDPAVKREHAECVEELGFPVVWVPGAGSDTLFEDVDLGLTSTHNTIWATGILNIWMHEPADTAAWVADVGSRHPGRLILGLGASHPQVLARYGRTYTKPLTSLRTYVDDLEGCDPPVAARQMMLAALGPKMLDLAARRTAGAHTYLVTPEHTAEARQIMGHGPALVPDLKVLLEADPHRAREVARDALALYLGLPNYLRSFERLGFTSDDFEQGGSDRLVDALVTWGDEEKVLRRIREHLDAGADHVCVQVIGPHGGLKEQWRRISESLPSDLR